MVLEYDQKYSVILHFLHFTQVHWKFSKILGDAII